MAVSARLKRETEAKLTRFCRARGISKTEAIERGVDLLIANDRGDAHPAFLAYQQLTFVPEAPSAARPRSSDAMRTALRAKYPD